MAKKIIRRKGSERSWFREVGYGKPPDWYLEDEVVDDENDEEDIDDEEE